MIIELTNKKNEPFVVNTDDIRMVVPSGSGSKLIYSDAKISDDVTETVATISDLGYGNFGEVTKNGTSILVGKKSVHQVFASGSGSRIEFVGRRASLLVDESYQLVVTELDRGCMLVQSNQQNGAAYTIARTDGFKVVEMTSGSANDVTFEENTLPVGALVNVARMGAGTTTVNAGVNVTFVPAGPLVIPSQYGEISFRQRAANVWHAVGSIQ